MTGRGSISWEFATSSPALTERLIILNLPHPRNLARELAHDQRQQETSAYARTFQQEGAHRQLTVEGLSSWVQDAAARVRYIEALQHSDFEAMLHYYKQHYPHPPYQDITEPLIKVQAPVLQIHGLLDQYLLPGVLNTTWQWLESDWTLLTIPHAGHFVQHDATDLVNRTILSWLAR